MQITVDGCILEKELEAAFLSDSCLNCELVLLFWN